MENLSPNNQENLPMTRSNTEIGTLNECEQTKIAKENDKGEMEPQQTSKSDEHKRRRVDKLKETFHEWSTRSDINNYGKIFATSG